MNRTYQKGSAHVIVTVVSVIGLLCALGFIFWQNFINKPAENKTQTETVKTEPEEKKTVKLLEASIDEAFSSSLTFSYPEDWKLEEQKEGPFPLNVDVGNSSQTMKVTAPSGKLSVRYSMVANGGLGGYCIPEEEGTVAKLEYEQLKDFSDASFATLVKKTITGKYVVSVGLDETSIISSVKAGDSNCDVLYSDIFKLNEDQNLTLTQAAIYMNELYDKSDMSKEFDSIGEIDAKLVGSEYEQARAILLSTKVSKK